MTKESDSPLLLYQTPDGRTRLEVRMQGETVWLTQAQMAELFQRERSVITKHIRNIFEEGELVETSVCANYAQTAADGKTYHAPGEDASQVFFATMQNKMHWAAHGHTAAEVVHGRVNAGK